MSRTLSAEIQGEHENMQKVIAPLYAQVIVCSDQKTHPVLEPYRTWQQIAGIFQNLTLIFGVKAVLGFWFFYLYLRIWLVK